jgi:hypothetical protein
MGEVSRARHVKLEREAAIKVLPSELASDPDPLKRFEREARAASALNHMARNVKEWCWNASGDARYILGGSWAEPTYMFKDAPDAQPPFARHPTHGFRCARFIGPPEEALLRPATPSYYEGEEEPVTTSSRPTAACTRTTGPISKPRRSRSTRAESASPPTSSCLETLRRPTRR